ncbi:MAG: hypothetical protein PGN13_04030 [Patulibacter minatonensis]
MSPSRVLPLSLLAFALAAPAPASAASTVKFPCYDKKKREMRFIAKPKSCWTYDPAGQEIVPSQLRSMKWKKWGKSSTKATAKLTTPALTGKVQLIARGLKVCSDELTIYTAFKVKIVSSNLGPSVKGATVYNWSGIPCPAV